MYTGGGIELTEALACQQDRPHTHTHKRTMKLKIAHVWSMPKASGQPNDVNEPRDSVAALELGRGSRLHRLFCFLSLFPKKR